MPQSKSIQKSNDDNDKVLLYIYIYVCIMMISLVEEPGLALHRRVAGC